MDKKKELDKFFKKYSITDLSDITSDVIEKVCRDNSKDRKRTKSLLTVILFLSMYISGASIYLSYLVYQPKLPYTMLADGKGGFTKITPIINPRVTVRQASTWAAKRSSELLSLHHKKYPAQINYYKSYFLGEGGNLYHQSLIDNGVLATLDKDNLIITAINTAEPRRARRYRVDGALNWEFQIPMIQTIQGMSDDLSTVKRVVAITVQETSRDLAISGLQIRSFKMIR